MPKQKRKSTQLNAELPNLKGKGVELLRLPDIDRLAEDYVTERDKRLRQTPKEVAAKLKLIAALHANADKLKQPDGTLVYRFDEQVITLTAGKEKLKVQSSSDEEE